MTKHRPHPFALFTLIVLAVGGSFWFASSVSAADPITLAVPIAGKSTVADAGEYINIFYSYFLKIISGLAMFMVLLGGIRWITAAGNSSTIGSAKQMITSALIGLILAYTSVLILRFINIDLVELNALNIPPITPAGPTGLFSNACPETVATPGVECGGVYLQDPGKGTTCTAWKDTCPTAGDYCVPVNGGQQWKCMTLQNYCEIESGPGDCAAVDTTVLNLFHNQQYGCAKDEVALGLSRRCEWGQVLFCDSKNDFKASDADSRISTPAGAISDPARASCIAGGDDSECNNSGQPEDCDIASRTMCTDDGRAIKGADCICCKLIADMQCQNPCEGDRTEVSDQRCIERRPGGSCAAWGMKCCSYLKRNRD